MARTDLDNITDLNKATEPHFSIIILDHYHLGVPPVPSRVEEPDLDVTELALPPQGIDGLAVRHYQVTGPLLSIQKYTVRWYRRWYRNIRRKLQAITTADQWEYEQDELFAELQMLAQLCYASQAVLSGPTPQSLIDAVEARFGQ